MQTPQSFSDVIELWPSAVELGREINVKEVTVRAWKSRGIPAEYWPEIEAAAHARGLHQVTIRLLAEMAARDAGRSVPDESSAPDQRIEAAQ